MKRKQIFATAAVCALLVGVLAIPASAHGGHHGRRAAATTYPTCTVEDCALTYRHDHDGTTYCGHSVGDGHTQCAATTTTRRHGGCR